MEYVRSELQVLLNGLDLGNSVAELDGLLERARIETSTFSDLVNDKVDLLPGTKGSGKSALFRIFVQFLPDHLLQSRQVIVAHGVDEPGDPVFHAFKSEFESLSESEFLTFWCIYLVSLAHEQFIKSDRYAEYLAPASREIELFRNACAAARIPEIEAKKSLRGILRWTLNVLQSWRPKARFKLPEDQGELELDLFGQVGDATTAVDDEPSSGLPDYADRIRHALVQILEVSGLTIWLMIDRLDEIFPRRSDVERTALRGLLHAMRFFSSQRVRVKIFLRDDMLDEVVSGPDGFVALTHVTARQADTMRWTENQILSLIVKRVFANDSIRTFLNVDSERLEASADYRQECFYKVFPATVHRGKKQSSTITWIFTRCSDGRGVVTPRDVLDLLIRARQWQLDACINDPSGTQDTFFAPAALQYGLEELSKRKRQTFLQAEFPHIWPQIEKLVGGKTNYDDSSMKKLFGAGWKDVVGRLIAIGVLRAKQKKGENEYIIPYLYRKGLEVTRGRA